MENLKFKNYPAFYVNKVITPGMKLTLIEMGPCQQLANDLPIGKFPRDTSQPPRSFSTSYYSKLINGKPVHRSWIAYSPSVDKIFC